MTASSSTTPLPVRTDPRDAPPARPSEFDRGSQGPREHALPWWVSRRWHSTMTRAVGLGGMVLLGLSGVACNRTLDEEQCRALVDRFVDLVAESQPSDKADQVKASVKGDKLSVSAVRDSCVGRITKAQYDCVMNARTFEAALGCDGR